MLARAIQSTYRRTFSSSAAPRAPPSKVGFIGLGNMGGHMAANLLAAGKEVCVFDIADHAVEAAKAKGASAGATPADVARECGKCGRTRSFRPRSISHCFMLPAFVSISLSIS